MGTNKNKSYTKTSFSRNKKVKQQVKKLKLTHQIKSELVNKCDIDICKESSFSDLGVHELILKALKSMKYDYATYIQSQVIPEALKCYNILASDKTGSGKTLAYLIPLLHILLKLEFRLQYGLGGLVLVPTKELCLQVASVLEQLNQFTNFRYTTLNESNDMTQSPAELMKGYNIIIATPHYFYKLIKMCKDYKKSNKNFFKFDWLKVLVLDEADQFIAPKYKDVMDRILTHLPTKRINMMLSATLPTEFDEFDDELNALTKTLFEGNEYSHINGRFQDNIIDNLTECYVMLEAEKRLSFIYSMVKANKDKKILIFMSTAEEVEFLYKLLYLKDVSKNIVMLHSKMNPKISSSAFIQFNTLESGILLCDDALSRGVDIEFIDVVVQYDIPLNRESYVHRIGRTARGLARGHSILLLRPKEDDIILPKIKLNKRKISRYTCPIVESSEGNVISIPDNSELKLLAEKAFTEQMFSYRKSKFIESVNHIDLKKEMVNFGLSSIPKTLDSLFYKMKVKN